jgi:uncharacterized protein
MRGPPEPVPRARAEPLSLAREKVVRPVVRAFNQAFEREAAAHARAGGHAVVWSSPKRARLVFRRPVGPKEKDLGYWSLLDLRRSRWSTVRSGPLRGLAAARIPGDCLDIVRERIVRDSIHLGAKRMMHLDCQKCAACCRKNRVELVKVDFARFRRAGRMDLVRPPYVRRDGNKLVLRLLQSKDCRHLQQDNRCAIYELRPESCRTFPPGSEGCLFSREEELGIVDGVRS